GNLLEPTTAPVREQLVAEEKAILPTGNHSTGHRRGVGLATLGRPVARGDVDPHVRMHAGDEEVEPTIAVEVEYFRPHGTPGCFRKVLRGRVAKPLPALIEPEVIPSLHVEAVEVGKAVGVHVEGRRIAAPAEIHQPDLATHVLEPVAAQVAVENTRFGALGVEVAK